MRFDTRVRFWDIDYMFDNGSNSYIVSPAWTGSAPSVVADVMGNVTDLGDDRTKELLGSYENKVKVVRLIEPPKEDYWNYLTIGDDDKTQYQVLLRRTTSKMTIYIVEEQLTDD